MRNLLLSLIISLVAVHYVYGAEKSYPLQTGKDAVLLQLALSPGAKYAALTYMRNKEWFIQINGQAYPSMSDSYAPMFSPDGENYCFVSQGKDGYTFHTDGKDFGPYATWLYQLNFYHRNGKYIPAFIYIKDEKIYFNTGDDSFGPMDDIHSVFISPDAKQSCVIYARGKNWYVQVGERSFGPLNELEQNAFQFSPKGDHFSLVYSNKEGFFVQTDKQKWGPYGKILPPVFSDSGKRFGFIYQEKGKWKVRVDNDVYGAYDEVDGMVFSENDESFGFAYRTGDKWKVKFNDEIYDGKDRAWTPYISGGGGHCYFLCTDKNHQWYVKHYDEVIGQYDRVWNLTIVPDGSGVCYISEQKNEWYVHLAGKSYGPYSGLSLFSISPYSNRFSITYEKGNSKYVYFPKENKTYGPFYSVSEVQFSPDNESFAFIYRVYDAGGKSHEYIQLNDKTYGPYSLAAFQFSKDSRATIAFVKNNQLTVKENPEK